MSIKHYRQGAFARGLRELCEWLPDKAVMVEIGSYAGESAEIFAQSGYVRRLTCVDLWAGDHYSQAEPRFDAVAARHPSIIVKRKAKGIEVATEFETQSLDFAYVDADHAYEKVKADVAAWRPKIRAGGWIGGHDYCHKFAGVIRAVAESFGHPEHVFCDTSWLVRIPDHTFQIITYCSRNFVDALRFTLPGWLDRSGAASITVYTDCEDLGALIAGTVDPRVTIRRIHDKPSANPIESWDRKIQVLTHAYPRCLDRNFVWLDSDCWVSGSIRGIFDAIGKAHLGATRGIGRCARGRGQANAGVIPFRWAPELAGFFHDWAVHAKACRLKGEKTWYEQRAFSEVAIAALDGLRPYVGAVISEKRWNLENDDDRTWLAEVAAYKPSIVHFKAGRWAKAEFREQVERSLR